MTKVIHQPKVEINQSLLEELEAFTQEENQVIMHFLYKSDDMGAYIRIWPTSYLFDVQSPHQSQLLHAERITYFPFWTLCHPSQDNYFTLIFSGLPKSCKLFDFVEDCGGSPGAFEVRNIPRTNNDVYYLKLSSL